MCFFFLFLKFKSTLEFFFKTSIVTMYSDGGGEYKRLKSFFESHRIQYLISPPYTLQLVASVESRHCHIVETSLTLLHQVPLALLLWCFAFQIAIYLINRLPTLILKNKSFQMLLNKTPNYSKLWIFCCFWYPWMCPYNKHKLEVWSHPYIFLGYSNLHNTYVCFAPGAHKFVISRHIQFMESMFPSFKIFHARN